jgi:hypothetical protein
VLPTGAWGEPGIYDMQAKDRQKSVGGTGKKAVPVNLPEAVKGDARDQAAKAVGVSDKET